MTILTILLFSIALQVDTLAISLAHGGARIKIPMRSALFISAISCIVLYSAILLSSLLSPLLPEYITKYISAGILILIGILKLKTQKAERNSIKADLNSDKVLSLSEAATLAFAISIDGFFAGLSLGNISSTLEVLVTSFCIGLFAIFYGTLLGNKIAMKYQLDISWLSGIILIFLGIIKAF